MTGVLQLLVASMVLHPSHQTLAEVEWNTETRRMEVSLMFDVLDEQWIERHHGAGDRGSGNGKAGDDLDEPVDDWRLRYLGRHFRFSADRPETDLSESDRLAADVYRWVGRKQEGGHVWWFFEVSVRGGERPRWLTSRVLFDRDDRYAHRVVVLGTKPRRVLELTPDRPSGELESPTAPAEGR